jgi:hypothetical protein
LIGSAGVVDTAKSEFNGVVDTAKSKLGGVVDKPSFKTK